MEVNNNLKKIQLILQYVYEGKIVIQENYVEKLLKFLEDNDENSPGKLIMETPFFSDLVYQALVDINNANTSAKVFLLKLITVIFKNELQFNKMYMQGFKLSFCKLKNLYNFKDNPPTNLYLASLELATVQITHSSGLNLILECKLWKNILQPNIHLRPKNISNAVYNFMSTLVSKLNEYNLESELSEIFEYVLEPIRNSGYFTLNDIDIETDTVQCNEVFTHISVLLAIITKANKCKLNNKVIPLLKERFVIDFKLMKIYIATKNSGLQQLISACIFRLSFGVLQPLLFSKKIEEFCMRMTVAYHNFLITLVKKRDPFTIMDYIIQSNLMWSDIERSYATELDFPLMFEQNGYKIEFSLQIFIPFIMPIAKYIGQRQISKNLEISDLLEQFLAKMSKTVTDYMFSCCFKYGELLDEAGVTFKKKLTTQALKELLRLMKHLSESQAGQVVQILDLLDICVKKFLSPNMSLLVEGTSRQGSTLNEIGEVIKLYTQHEEWEVRDSAFNLLKSCTDISFIKYIPLQKVIKANNLIILAAKAGLNDSEFYSQCTALKCLAAATKIDSIWQEVLMDNEYFYLQLVYIVRNHTEGMVRKEAANVLTGVYINQRLESGFQNNLNDVMTSAALVDLHWEVQLVALQFWKKVIYNHLTYRGMIDGKFPSVTFSKEKRKIVVLDKEEIQRQLVGVMNGLSAVGCLTVLVECMNEVHNTDVMMQAHFIAKELIEILKKYKFKHIDNAPVNTEEIPLQYKGDKYVAMDLSGAANIQDRDKVIDSILSENQVELIINLHDNFTQTKFDEMDIDYPCYYQHRKLVRPNEFLDIFRGTDYSLLIDNKKNFYADNMGTLDSLLDEILDLESNQ